MSTRRDFLRKLGIGVGVGAAGAAIAPLLLATPKVLATATSDGGTFTRTLDAGFIPVVVDAQGSPLSPTLFRTLVNSLHVKYGDDVALAIEEFSMHPVVYHQFVADWMDGQPWPFDGASWDRGVKKILVCGTPIRYRGTGLVSGAPRHTVYASRGVQYDGAVLLGKIVNVA